MENNELKKNISSFPSKIINYFVNENLNKDLAVKQRELYAKYFSLASNDQSLSEHINNAYPSKIIDWLKDRENQNNATMGYWIIKNYCLPIL